MKDSTTQQYANLSSHSAERMLKDKELAARHNRSVRTVQADRISGVGVPYVKIGRSVRYRLSDILAFEEKHLRRSSNGRVFESGEQP